MSDHTTVTVDGEEVRISSPGRVVFPTQGWTKLDVIEHFVRVAPGAARGISRRPTMLKRYMQNVTVDPIYHKRASKNSPFDTLGLRIIRRCPVSPRVSSLRNSVAPTTNTDVEVLEGVATLQGHRESDQAHRQYTDKFGHATADTGGHVAEDELEVLTTSAG